MLKLSGIKGFEPFALCLKLVRSYQLSTFCFKLQNAFSFEPSALSSKNSIFARK